MEQAGQDEAELKPITMGEVWGIKDVTKLPLISSSASGAEHDDDIPYFLTESGLVGEHGQAMFLGSDVEVGSVWKYVKPDGKNIFVKVALPKPSQMVRGIYVDLITEPSETTKAESYKKRLSLLNLEDVKEVVRVVEPRHTRLG